MKRFRKHQAPVFVSIALCFIGMAACGGQRTERIVSGDHAVVISPSGAVLTLAGPGGTLKAADPGAAGFLIYGNTSFPLSNSTRSRRDDGSVLFTYIVKGAPFGVKILNRLERSGEVIVFSREITVEAGQRLDQDLKVRILLGPVGLDDATWLPLKNGVGAGLGTAASAAYKFAGPPAASAIPLSIPMVSGSALPLAERCTIATDPYYSTTFDRDAVEWTYAGAIGLEGGSEKRSISIILHAGDPDAALKQFYDVALKDVPPGPGWLHDIAMVDYDFLGNGGKGWFNDIDALESVIAKEDRQKVLLCCHGWYDYVGRYCYDAAKGTLDREWIAFGNAPNTKNKSPKAVPLPMSLAKVHERLEYAKSRGFRVGLYFGDGLNAGNGLTDIYRPDRVLFWGGWEGPDTKGKTYCQNPLHPDVRAFFKGYLDALLREFGPDIDALAWDETFHVDSGSLGSEAFPGYADRAMMTLVRGLTSQVHDYNARTGRQVAFLASDCIGILGWLNKAPYALVADGTFQDSRCLPNGWSYGIFPNYRNVLWSCNWEPVARFDYTEFGVRNYQAPVAVANGDESDQGFANMPAAMKKKIIDLFNWRKAFRTNLKWFSDLPVFPGKAK
jgi:hypothetical protein